MSPRRNVVAVAGGPAGLWPCVYGLPNQGRTQEHAQAVAGVPRLVAPASLTIEALRPSRSLEGLCLICATSPIHGDVLRPKEDDEISSTLLRCGGSSVGPGLCSVTESRISKT